MRNSLSSFVSGAAGEGTSRRIECTKDTLVQQIYVLYFSAAW